MDATTNGVTGGSGVESDIAEAIVERVRERYAQAAQQAQSGGGCGCGGACCGDTVSDDLYAAEQVAGLPEEAVLASLGCGNPTALIDLREGETVLDLGSGGGIDVLLSAKRVGPTGFAYRPGYDRRDAGAGAGEQGEGRRHQRRLPQRAHRGHPAASRESWMWSSATASSTSPPTKARCCATPSACSSLADASPSPMWSPMGLCPRIAPEHGGVGRLPRGRARRSRSISVCSKTAGFEDVSIEITRRYTVAEAGLDPATLPDGWEAGDGKLASAFVRATKPATAQMNASASVMTTATPVALVSRAEAKPTAPKGCC